MLVIGLTGGTGAGKSVAAAALTEMGIPCLDTDSVSRKVCGPGQPCTLELAETFGGEILDEDGSLRRGRLAELVFGESDGRIREEKRNTLNRITHSYILEACRMWLKEQEAEGKKAACIDAPQLFESGFDRECDKIIGITAKRKTRIERIRARDGISVRSAHQRIAAQHSEAFFRKHCSVLLRNNGTPDNLASRVREAVSPWIR
ncbi:MAG: dephospho-CoA kinase [Clostridia bacterium]|nr:dephospho-CoA kinase [Clostridia bacterium]